MRLLSPKATVSLSTALIIYSILSAAYVHLDRPNTMNSELR